MILFRDGGGSETAASAEPDAGAAAPAPDAAPQAPANLDQVLADAEAALRGDTRAGIENALQAIEAFAADPAASADALMAAARLEAALAQHLLDEADAAERASRRKQLITEARERADRIETLATRAEEIEPGNAAAMVARGDALRLRGRPAREVERWLRRALQKEAGHREALLARALLYARDRRPRQARQVLEDIEPAPGDVRAAYRLARLEVEDKSYEAAREKIAEVLAAEPEHAGAAALKEKVTEALAAADDDDGGDEPAEQDKSGGDDGGDSDSGGGGIDSYDRLLARADKLAERGRCEEAKGVYQKALDANPSGVAALTGLGYCYLDSRQFASAHARFRAALGISSRYQSALWGMGELYERQGLKDKAIEAFERFIEAHPTSRRAETARRRIEKLGGTVGGGSGQGSDDEGGEAPDGAGNETGSGADSPGDGSSESSSPPDP